MNNTYKLQIIHAKGNFVISAKGKVCLYDIKKYIAERLEAPISSLTLRLGSNRKKIEFPESSILYNTGIQSGEALIVETRQSSLRRLNSLTMKSSTCKFQQVPDSNGLVMIKRVILADNSCLFNSVAYALENKSRDSATYLRQIVASYIVSDPEKYNEAFLDRSNQSYQKWILDSLNWGGAIETEILSQHYNAEICTIDIQNFSTNLFGSEQNYKKRVYLLYDGVHYDVVARNISEDMPEEMDSTIFHPLDNCAFDGVMMLAKELNYKARDPVENDKSLDYGLCSPKLCENVAHGHYQQAGHYKFSEVAP